MDQTDIIKYLETNVDIYLKPMLVDLLKQQPENILDFMKDWMHNKGLEIRNANSSTHKETAHEEPKHETNVDHKPHEEHKEEKHHEEEN